MKGAYFRNTRNQTSQKLKILKALQKKPMEYKLNFTKKIIEKALDKGHPALLFSGGKDSTVLLDIIRTQTKNILIMHNDTTLGDTKILEFIKKATTGMNYVKTTAEDPIKMWKKTGYYPILSKRGFTQYKKRDPTLKISPVQCCYQLKEKYANRILKKRQIKVVFWGNRASESNRRKLSCIDSGFLFKPVKYKWWQAYPLQHWTREDIQQYLTENLPSFNHNHSLEGGCKCCCTDITFHPNNISRLYASDNKKWMFYMKNGFALQIGKIKGLRPEEIDRVLQQHPRFFTKI